MEVKINETIFLDFTTHNSTTGAVSDADSTPIIEVFENDTDIPIITPTPVKRTDKTGNYRVQIDCTSANGFDVDKTYNVVTTATVGGVTGKGVVGQFIVRSRQIADIATPSDILTNPANKIDGSYIDASISSRSTLTAQNVWEYATRTLTGFGSLISDIWSYVTRTLTAGTKDAEIDAIKAKTDNLPSDPASNSAVLTRASQASVDLIPTNPLLTNDPRLDNLDTSISSRLSISDTRLDNLDAPISSRLSANDTRLDNLGDIDTKLGNLDVPVSSRLSASDSRLNNLDVPVSSRLSENVYKGLVGNLAITINTKDPEGVPLTDVEVFVYNSDQSVLLTASKTNNLGVAYFALDAGIYKLWFYRTGYSFPNPVEIQVTTNNQSFDTIGSKVITNNVGGVCRVYEFLADQQGNPVTEPPVATATIVSLPYDYYGRLHIGTVIQASFNPITGMVYWDIVYGAVVTFSIPDFGVYKTDTVPSTVSARLTDI